jgi:CheY-like chemotaxis protein
MLVLIVEDSEDHRTLAESFLRKGGYEAVCAHDGAEALRYLRAHATPDVILLDLRMPIMDGFAFLAAQQNEPELAVIPVVIYSCEHRFRGERGFTPSVVCCVSKTDGSEVLLSAVRLALATARARN